MCLYMHRLVGEIIGYHKKEKECFTISKRKGRKKARGIKIALKRDTKKGKGMHAESTRDKI